MCRGLQGLTSRQGSNRRSLRFSLRMLVIPCIVRQVPAAVPIDDFLEKMMGDRVGVATIFVAGVLVVEKPDICLIVDSDALQALKEPIVFPALLGEALLALPPPVEVDRE